jgi:hypothetical protein
VPQLMTFQYSQSSAQWINGAWRTSTTFNGLPTYVGQSTTNGVDPAFKIEPYNNSLTPATWSVTPTTSWAAAGTAIGVNSTAAFGGNFIDCKLNGTSRFSVNSTGAATFAAGVTTSGALSVAGTTSSTGAVYTPATYNFGALSAAQATIGQSLSANYISTYLAKSSNGLYSNTWTTATAQGVFAPLQIDYLQTCSQYLTPDSVAPSSTPIATTGGTSALTTATLTTSAAHGLLPGQIVYITGIAPIGYNGIFVLQTASGSTLTYTTPGSAIGATTVNGKIIPLSATPIAITAITYSGFMATVTVASHPFKTGSVVAIQGLLPAQFNGVFNVIVPDGSTTTFSYLMQVTGTAPTLGTSYASGMVLPTPLVNSAVNGSAPITITAITFSTTTITATVGAHPYTVGEWVTIIGVTGSTGGSPNGAFQITSVNSTQIAYVVPVAPIGTLTGGTVQTSGYNNPFVGYGPSNITSTGMRAMVSNNTATAAAAGFAAAPTSVSVVGAGNTVPVYWNGTAWAIG